MNDTLESCTVSRFRKFEFIDPYRLSSWADVVVVCAANGLEPDTELFWLLTLGSFWSKQVQKMLMHTLKETTLLDDIACKQQALEIVYTVSCLIGNPKYVFIDSIELENIPSLSSVWYTLYPNQPETDYIDPYQSSSIDSTKKYCINLFKIIDLKFPLAWLKFYSANSKKVRLNNMFMKFLLSTTRAKAKLNRQFQPLLELLEKDVNKHEAKAMHLV